MSAYESAPRWHDRPPTYERLLVDTLVDIRRNAHKHALLASSRKPASQISPVSPYTPQSDQSSIHTEGTFDIDLKSIWSQKTAVSTADGLSVASSDPSSRASSPTQQRPRSLGDESFFPAPISPTSFLPDDDDDDLNDDPLSLSLDFDEPAPAYDADASTSDHSTISRPSTSMTYGTHARTASAATVDSAVSFDVSLLDDEDPWVAFAALCWAACVVDDPDNPPPHAFGRRTTMVPRSALPAPIAEEPEPESEPEPEPESAMPPMRAPEPMRYNAAFSRTEPDLTVGVWSLGDNAVTQELGLEDELGLELDFEVGIFPVFYSWPDGFPALPISIFSPAPSPPFRRYALDSRRLRPPRSRTPGLAPRVHKLEYVPPRPPSPPRTFHKPVPTGSELRDYPLPPVPSFTHARTNSGGFKRLWRWRGKENATF
ncbi:hypothetical protein K488DRAFT_87885 [Vararia minispora EC-137]|uniref:Uncharacterized protein n=1 Tax=Vararia minispora EC-137 TaxID=1314806 RepID=A0ACB8QF56_9AGAM|nr:hypothetical protein K488DRAFT_87885 [Vararia minispora EC-137]